MFSEPENTMFPQLTDSHRLLSGSGLSRCMLRPALAMEGGEDAGDMTLQVPQRPSEQGQDGARRHRICPEKNQMVQRADGCRQSGQPGQKPKTRL